MSPTRRDFLKATTSTAAALAVGNLAANVGADARSAQAAAQTLPAPAADPAVIELANEALNAARGAGASYADVRVGRYRRQGVATRERQVLSVSDNQNERSGAEAMTHARALVQAQGVTFANAHVPYPLCCPARATFLTGQYSHNNNVMANGPPTGGYAWT
jgi:hypothetical protein